jgi:hypothetical protein
MFEFLFVLTFWFTFMYLVALLSLLLGRDCTIPVPFLHNWGYTHRNVYVSYPFCMYQVWFWFNYLGVI